MTLRLRTFGAVYLERDGTELGGVHAQRRRLAMLASLAAADRGAVPRERLLAMLWPESDTASARHSLSQLLYALRSSLGAEVVAVDGDVVRLNRALIESDVGTFSEALRLGDLETAVAQYHGAFLDGFYLDDAAAFNRWADDARTRLTHDCLRALTRLADAAERAGDGHRAIEWLRARVALDPTDGRTVVRLMNALVGIGDREGALRSARIYESVVRSELEAEPDAAVTRLAGEIRATTGAPRALVGSDSPQSPPAIKEMAPPVVAVPGDVIPPPPVPAPRHPTVGWRRTMLSSKVLAVAALAVVALVVATRTTGGSPWGDDRRDVPVATVMVGELASPDTMLALAVREGLRAELANTRGLRITTERGMHELRTLMRWPADSTMRTTGLLALAARGGAHFAITGSVFPLGEGAQIVLELLDARSGRTIRTLAERPVSAPATLVAIERMARSLGAAASRAPLDTTVRPLPAVTTSSLAALKSYALARQTAASGRRLEAVEPAERALAHDSTFVLAHYFLGDLLWFIDEQTHSEAHLARAYQLMGSVAPREQLVIRARYEQLAHDQPDSALAYWQLLAESNPGDPLAHEGRTWALRALGRHEEAAASADSAMTADPTAIQPNLTNAIYSWLSVGDTTSALAVATRVARRYPEALIEARYYAALMREPRAALQWVDRTTVPASRHFRRHMAQVAMGDVAGSRITLDSVLRDSSVQMPPNSLLNQGWLELTIRGDSATAAASARRTLAWTRNRDLSPPAVGRLSERIADLAARVGDEATVRATIAFVRERDRGRGLRTYAMTQRMLDAALAYAQGDYARAARLAEGARHGVYFSRSLSTIVNLEADARRRIGDAAAADSLMRLLETRQIVDGNFEVWLVLRSLSRMPPPSARRISAPLPAPAESGRPARSPRSSAPRSPDPARAGR